MENLEQVTDKKFEMFQILGYTQVDDVYQVKIKVSEAEDGILHAKIKKEADKDAELLKFKDAQTATAEFDFDADVEMKEEPKG